jgi:cytochrome P450
VTPHDASGAIDLRRVEYPTPELVECPYVFYRALRERAPVHRLPNGDYLVSRWDDIVTISQRLDVFSCFLGSVNPGWAEAFGWNDAEDGEPETLTPWPLAFSDPPEHRLKRSLVALLVTRDRLKSFERLIAELSDEIIDGFAGRGNIEFLAEFADVLPPLVMLRIFDVPRADELMIRAWMSASQGQGFRHASEEQRAKQVKGMTEGRRYFRELILERQAGPSDDFLSELIQFKVERDGTLDLTYLVSEVTTLYSAAYHNTVYMLANTMLLLLQNPETLARVAADRSLLRATIEESLRIETPVQWLQRIALEDVVIGGTLIPKGSVVLILYGSANRDERKFAEPDRFLVPRPDISKQQLAFGHGQRLCIGAPLARLEGQIAFDRLLDRLPNMRLAPGQETIRHITTVNHRGPKAVHMEFDAG